jgi:nucleoside-diphosphate-sugar epimerase
MADRRIALVTGGTGFVGANLVRRLVKDGWETHIVIRHGSDMRMLTDIESVIRVHGHEGSTEQLIDIMKLASPQVVFHLASLFLAQHAPQDVEPLIRSNLLFSTQLIEAMSVNGVRHLINTGTSWQYGENGDYNPVCLYAATKQAFETILMYYVAVSNLSAISLQLFDTYGPDDPRAKLFTLLRKTASTGEPLLMSPGEQLMDMVYIDDVLEAYLLAAERLLQGKVAHHEVYAVTSGKPIRLRHLVETYEQVIGRVLAVKWGERPYRSREVMRPWNNGTVVPGWEPKTALEAGMARMEQNSGLLEQERR